MTHAPPPRLAAFVAAAPTVAAERRTSVLQVVEPLASRGGGLLLVTCHRVEWIAGEHGAGAPGAGPLGPVPGDTQRLEGIDVARHLIELTIGLHSAVLAEDQILHQVRRAVTDARRIGPLGPDLELLLDLALRAGRLGRSWRPVSGPGSSRSLAGVALERIVASWTPDSGRRLLVVGAGRMGEALAVAARHAGMEIMIASPSVAHARLVAERHGAQVSPFDPGARVADVDAIVVALSGPWHVADATAQRVAGLPIVVDLSMPPAVTGSLRDRLGDRLVDIDAMAPGGSVRASAYRQRLGELAEQTLADYRDRLAMRAVSRADRLAERVEHQRLRHLDDYLRERPDMDPAVRDALDDVTRDLTARLFRVPMARLANDPDGRRERAVDELFGA